MQDLESLLSLEIKKEIADRYFGFRKMIEDDSRQYNRNIRAAYRQLENDVGFDLIRLYILLGQEPLIHNFFRITGLRDQLFLDAYLLQAKTIRQRLFKGQPIHGLTRRSRFHHLFLDIYTRLRAGMATYGATLDRLARERAAISEEIEVFQRKNDLGAIMGFLRGLDGGSLAEVGPMAGGVMPLRDSTLAEKMRVTTPAAPESLLPAFPTLPPVKSCKGALRDLIDAAFEAQGKPEVLHYAA